MTECSPAKRNIPSVLSPSFSQRAFRMAAKTLGTLYPEIKKIERFSDFD
jgi:hypothetical protein